VGSGELPGTRPSTRVFKEMLRDYAPIVALSAEQPYYKLARGPDTLAHVLDNPIAGSPHKVTGRRTTPYSVPLACRFATADLLRLSERVDQCGCQSAVHGSGGGAVQCGSGTAPH
jgi:hypothetical protein